MTRRSLQFILFLLGCLLAVLVNSATKSPDSMRGKRNLPKLNSAGQVRLCRSYGRLPLSFEVNRGQVDRQARFLARGNRYNVYLTSDEVILSIPEKRSRGLELPRQSGDILPEGSAGSLLRFRDRLPGSSPSARSPAASIVAHIRLEGASRTSLAFGLQELPGKVNYFVGNDPRKWRTDIPTYARVKYNNIYPGIDLVYYGNQGQLEHDFIVAPGADPGAIKFIVENGDKVEVDALGDLLLDEMASLRLRKPVIYQERNGVRTEIAGRYVLGAGHQVGFQVENYDASLPLVIDPVLVYSTYLGGTDDDDGAGIAVDSSGNAYIAGTTRSADFPMASAFQPNLGDPNYGDAFVLKLNASGDALVYSTYFGGNTEDFGSAIALDSSGNAYVTGATSSDNLPAVNAFQAKKNSGRDAFVFKLNAAGNALVYSTYLGGSDSDYGEAIAVDSAGNAYVTGETYTESWPTGNDFPTVNPITVNTMLLRRDVFVAKLNAAGKALVYSTLIGGNGNDYAGAIAVDSSGNAYVTGYTESANFPMVNALKGTYGGGIYGDGYVLKLNATGNALVYSTYLGGSGWDAANSIAVDSSGNAYITGRTESADFPTANPLQPKLAGDGRYNDIFVSKLNASGSAFVYSTYLGGTDSDEGMGIAVDSAGNAYVTGYTASTDFPTVSPIQANFGGGIYGDAFVLKLNSAGSALLYSTYLGGSGDDFGTMIAIDSSGNAYVRGYTDSANFPTLSPFQQNPAGKRDSFALKIVNARKSTDLALAAGGAADTATVGTSGSVQAGYVVTTVQSGSVPYGTAVFSLSQGGVTVSEAAVPASPPTTSARIFVDYRSRVSSPIDDPFIDIDTGLAIVNRNSAAANVTYTLRKPDGEFLTAGHGRIAAGVHFAKFINQLKEVAPDFALPPDFPTTIQFGCLDIASDQPLSILALRLTINQRNWTLLTSTPIADLTKPPGNAPLYFPQFVDGGGYLTTLVLLNTSSAIETGRLALFSDGGTPLIVNQAGGKRDSTFDYSINPGGAFVFQTDGSPADAKQGSVQLTPNANTSSPVGAGIFSFSQGRIRVTESGVPAATPTTHARIYIDQSANHGTGLAIASPGASGISVTLKAYQKDGSTPAGNSTGPVNLSANGHTARFVSQLISALPSDFRGVLDITSSSPFVALTLRSLTNSRGNFLLTTFPIADAAQPAPTPVIFPQIADGGGYLTEFILLSAGGAAEATVNFYADDGTPLSVGK